ncbi:hypothetical protein [Lacimicrobium alkaliphilum]|uniref:Alginate export domain-containing protein n=1 Tax=Lacimicrobium alkaliphilum TaxID=1526571 RepID=A0ABQ1REC6_9ALTE|nr:hypothetical protein [Lacimicrobium alkaliphilum]GGD65444.1 hypothetical protein GCM10011357_20900 [Lacimicrobium alkaliphilum]
MKRTLVTLCLLASFTALADTQTYLKAAIEQRFYFQDALYPQQHNSDISVFVEPELYYSWNQGTGSINIKPFVRYDSRDSERTHWDLRELVWMQIGDEWEMRAGISKVFWGQTESQHLVDVINQTDFVEAIDGEDKLGQPMVQFSLIKDWGTLSAFALPYFRERTFAGADGRFRSPIAIDTDNPLYESDDEEKNLDWALRYFQYFGDVEIGLSYFDGTNREPDFIPQPGEDGMSLRPYYGQMQQTGLDMLAIAGGTLYKLEAIYRQTTDEDFYALTAGFEHTSVGVLNSPYDIGWLMEYQYDERGEQATSLGQNDVMLGSRIVFNDIDGTEVLIAYVQDLDETSSRSGFIEASSRISNNWKWRVDGWFFSSDTQDEPTYLLRRDDYIQFSLEYYF